MLTPARPAKGEPGYAERMARFRDDQADKRRRPENWGVVRGSAFRAAAARAAKTARKGAAE